MKSLLCIQRCSWKQQPRLARGTNSMVPSSSLFLGVGHGARAQREPRTVWNSSCSYEEVCSGGTQVGRAESCVRCYFVFNSVRTLSEEDLDTHLILSFITEPPSPEAWVPLRERKQSQWSPSWLTDLSYLQCLIFRWPRPWEGCVILATPVLSSDRPCQTVKL